MAGILTLSDRPVAAAWSSGAGVTAEVTRQAGADGAIPTGSGRTWTPGYPPCIARCALALITATVSASCSFGLNWMNSVPVSAAGTCPGVM